MVASLTRGRYYYFKLIASYLIRTCGLLTYLPSSALQLRLSDRRRRRRRRPASALAAAALATAALVVAAAASVAPIVTHLYSPKYAYPT